MLILFSDLSTKLQAVNDDIPEHIQRVVETTLSQLLIVSVSSYGSAVFTSEHLLKILDIFSSTKKVILCKEIFEAFKQHKTTSDAVLINTMLDVGRSLHDSIDSLSLDGERHQISKLLASFIDKIDFGKDLEQQLNMYVECRSIFSNLDGIKDKLILSVCGLIVKAYSYMKGIFYLYLSYCPFFSLINLFLV